MSRLWSRFGLRTLSVALLLLVVAGGMYVTSRDDRETQRADDVAASEPADDELAERAASRTITTSRQRAAQREAAEKAAAAAKAAALRARRVDEAATKKKEPAESGPTNDGKPPPFTGPIPASCNEFSGNRKTGCAMVLARGWSLTEFACLNKLWNRESGWNHKAYNEGSGAYGIPQALPGSKMESAGSDWRTNPATQIKWGLGYIKGRYKTPCRAWQHSEDQGWY